MATLSQSLVQHIVQEPRYALPRTWDNSPYLDWKLKDPKTRGTIGERIVSKIIGVAVGSPFKKGDKDLKNGEEVKTMFLTKKGKFCINRLKSDCNIIYLVIVQPFSLMVRKTSRDKLIEAVSLKQQGSGNNDQFKLDLSIDTLLHISTEVASC